MLDQGHPPHILAGWHGHDPAGALSIMPMSRPTSCAVGASLFGRSGGQPLGHCPGIAPGSDTGEHSAPRAATEKTGFYLDF
jgi:hypothetical protein